MPVVIDTEKCGKIKNCPGEGLCVKICEQGALVDEGGELVLFPDKVMTVTCVSLIAPIKPYLKLNVGMVL
jgi:ferredoxin